MFAVLIAKADVFVQNLKPGAIGKLGFPIGELRQKYPRLICCSISGYGEDGPYAARKAYDLLVQAEVGLASVTGGPDAPARVGFSVADIGAGMNAYQAILEALIARGRTGEGAAIQVSLFDAMAEWMTVPLLSHESGHPFRRIGLAHAAIAPYGVFKSRDGADILISIQNDREWQVLAEEVLGDAVLAGRSAFCHQPGPCEQPRRDRCAGRRRLCALDVTPLMEKLDRCGHRVCARQRLRAAFGASASAPDHGGDASRPRRMPAPAPIIRRGAALWRGAGLGEHTEKVRAEFLAG